MLARRALRRRMETLLERSDAGDTCKYGKKSGAGYDYRSRDTYVGRLKKVNIVSPAIYDAAGVVEDFCILSRLHMIATLVWILCSQGTFFCEQY